MKLFAISDLHVGHAQNREILGGLGRREGATRDDWLIVAGDVGETESHLELAFASLAPRFGKLIWVPGNHELWSTPDERAPDKAAWLRGGEKYARMIELARSFGVVTPEDPFVVWPPASPQAPVVIAPLFLLYDYSFRPDEVAEHDALRWAGEFGAICADEIKLRPEPHASKAAWCAARCVRTAARLEAELPPTARTVLVNHYPLLREHAVLPLLPRFSIWCGTRRTADWHLRFRAQVVVTGHLHLRTTRVVDGVRFEEVSLGYPAEWRRRGGPPGLRVILDSELDG